MASPLIPDSATLKSIKYTPSQLIADAAFETFIFDNNLTVFIRSMMTAYRQGLTQFDYEFAAKATAQTMKTYLLALGYTVVGPGPGAEERTLTVSWP